MFDELYKTETEAPATEVATTKPADVALEDIDLQKIALAHFAASDLALHAARQKLTGVVHDLSTAGKLAEAKSLRERLINAPLAEARKVNKGLKAKLTAVSKAVGARLEVLEDGFADVEKLITPQIEARDAEIAAEKAERERIEADRVAGHRANLARLAGYIAHFQGKPSAEIAAGIVAIERIEIIPEQWEEFAAGAETQKAETLQALRDLFARTEAAETEAAAREAQRIENERLAAELAEKERALAEKQAEVDRKLAALAAAEKAEADRIEAAAQAQRDAEARAAAEIEAFAHQQAEDEANRLAQEAAAEALQRATDATPAEIMACEFALAITPGPAEAPEFDAARVNELAPLGRYPDAGDMDEIIAKPWVLHPVVQLEELVADESYTGRMAVSPGVLHPTPDAGPLTFADTEPADPLAALLAHIDEVFEGRFSAHPKPTREWWGALRRLSDEARALVVA